MLILTDGVPMGWMLIFGEKVLIHTYTTY